jgi:hypothetical protein
MAIVSRLPDHSRPDRLRPDQRRQRRIFFSRRELDQLLQLYSRQVARGEWRDYAIDQSDGSAAFSVFRHSLDAPLYTIVKTAPGSSRHGDYALLHRRARLASGQALTEVLALLQRSLGGPRALGAWPASPA